MFDVSGPLPFPISSYGPLVRNTKSSWGKKIKEADQDKRKKKATVMQIGRWRWRRKLGPPKTIHRAPFSCVKSHSILIRVSGRV